MNPDWQTFLTLQGATLATDAEHHAIVQHFGNQAAELAATAPNEAGSTVLCDLSQYATLRVGGVDAQSFLQNLLSNDIREVSATQAQWSSFNTAKGRMLATFLIWRDGDDYLLQLPVSLAGALCKKLSMYVLRAKVRITPDECISLGLSGSDAAKLLQHIEVPAQPLAVSITENLTVIRLGEMRFQLSTTPEHAPALWQTLTTAKPVGSPCWDWLTVRAGIPVILPQTQEQFVPQMANLDLIGAINFKKGCYPGQEIVARMHYLGKLKRRMYLAHLDLNHLESDIAPQPGDEVFSADMGSQASGMIANVAAAPGGGYDVLAVMQSVSHDSQTVHLGSLLGAPLIFESLPYPLP